MSTHLLHSPIPQPAKKLRSCLSPSRDSRCVSPDDIHRPSSAASSASSAFTEGPDGILIQRKCVRWNDQGGCVTSTFATWSAQEYDRTPLAPPSEAERACVLPARGSRCLSFHASEADEEDESEDDLCLPRSPFATPEDSDDECDDEEWSECMERRRMMFARMCPLALDADAAQPQFEGYRSLSATLVDLLKSVGCEDDDAAGDGDDTPRPLSFVHDDESDDDEPQSHGFPVTDVFSRLREGREGSADSDMIGTPSLVSSADSDCDGSRLASPRGSAIDFLPFSSPQKGREREYEVEHLCS